MRHINKTSRKLRIILLCVIMLSTMLCTFQSNPIQILAEEYSFSDVNEDTPHAEDIQWMSDSNISTGWTESDGSKTYRGMDTVKRQDMAAFLRREAQRLGITDATEWTPSEEDYNRFSDVDVNTPHAEDILWLAHSGITQGYSDGTYRGMWPVYRQDMAAFLHRLVNDANINVSINEINFTDVNDSTPHNSDIRWLGRSGISTGYDNGNGTWRYEGMTPVYRQDMAAFIHRLDKLQKKDNESSHKELPGSIELTSFKKSGTSAGIVHYSVSYNGNGTNTHHIYFFSDGNSLWMKNHIQFKLENITPPAVNNMLISLGYDNAKIINTSIRYSDDSNEVLQIGGYYKYKSMAELTILTTYATKRIKITALMDGNLIDTYYAGGAVDLDKNIYYEVRHRVEKRLWNSSMDEYDKVEALATYLNGSMRYPGTNAVEDPYYIENYTWDGHSYTEGDMHYSWLVGDDADADTSNYLNRAMIYQGGTGTCTTCEEVFSVAIEDLKMQDLGSNAYPYTKLDIQAYSGPEGIYIGTGECSSSPGNPAHETLVYIGTHNGKKVLRGFDIQGAYTASSVNTKPIVLNE